MKKWNVKWKGEKWKDDCGQMKYLIYFYGNFCQGEVSETMNERLAEKRRIPRTFQPFLWSKCVGKMDRDKDKIYIVHQILSYGDLRELRHLFRIYDRKEVGEVFTRYPKRIYQPSVFYFVKNFILELKNRRLKEKDYVKALFWHLDQRTERDVPVSQAPFDICGFRRRNSAGPSTCPSEILWLWCF